MALKSYEELIKVDVRQYCEERDVSYKIWISGNIIREIGMCNDSRHGRSRE